MVDIHPVQAECTEQGGKIICKSGKEKNKLYIKTLRPAYDEGVVVGW